MAALAFLTLLGLASADEDAAPRLPYSVNELGPLEETVMATAARALPAVVFIDGGSGVLISPEGHIITNNHVIADLVRSHEKRQGKGSPAEVTVRISGGRRVRARMMGRDPGGDIALLKAIDPGPYPFLELGDSDALKPGQWVLAIGNPFLLANIPFAFFTGPSDFSPSVSLGIVSALHRKSDMYPDAIQVDVAVNPGSSGGPLITTEGKVVGINGKIQTRFLVEVNSGVGYSVPSNQIIRFLDTLKAAGGAVVRRGTIDGLVLADRGDSDQGLEVLRVRPSSPGEKAGFRSGDQILSIDGHSIWNRRRFEGLVATYPAGSKVAVKVHRGSETTEIAAVLDPYGPGWLGMFPEAAGPDQRGAVRVREVVDNGPAARSGLKVGDIILRIDGRRLDGVGDLSDDIRERRAGESITVVIMRGDHLEEHTIRLGARPEE